MCRFAAFFADFGPLDLGLTCTFCNNVEDRLKQIDAINAQRSGVKGALVYYCSDHPHRRVNSVVLILAYLVRTLVQIQFSIRINLKFCRYSSSIILLKKRIDLFSVGHAA